MADEAVHHRKRSHRRRNRGARMDHPEPRRMALGHSLDRAIGAPRVCLLPHVAVRKRQHKARYLPGVFHESTEGRSGWEKRNREFRTGREILNLNAALALVYLVLGGVSVCVPIAVAKGDTSGFQFAVFALSATVFVSTILLVALHSYPRDDYVTKWKGIK